MAISSTIKDSHPIFEWVEVKMKKSHRSYVDAVKSLFHGRKKADHISVAIGNVFSHLPSDLGRKSVFSRLIFRNHSHGHAKNTAISGSNHAVTVNGVNLDLNLGSSNSNQVVLTGANQVPLGTHCKPNGSISPSLLGSRNSSRCLSFSHSQASCTN